MSMGEIRIHFNNTSWREAIQLNAINSAHQLPWGMSVTATVWVMDSAAAFVGHQRRNYQLRRQSARQIAGLCPGQVASDLYG